MQIYKTKKDGTKEKIDPSLKNLHRKSKNSILYQSEYIEKQNTNRVGPNRGSMKRAPDVKKSMDQKDEMDNDLADSDDVDELVMMMPALQRVDSEFNETEAFSMYGPAAALDDPNSLYLQH